MYHFDLLSWFTSAVGWLNQMNLHFFKNWFKRTIQWEMHWYCSLLTCNYISWSWGFFPATVLMYWKHLYALSRLALADFMMWHINIPRTPAPSNHHKWGKYQPDKKCSAQQNLIKNIAKAPCPRNSKSPSKISLSNLIIFMYSFLPSSPSVSPVWGICCQQRLSICFYPELFLLSVSPCNWSFLLSASKLHRRMFPGPPCFLFVCGF